MEQFKELFDQTDSNAFVKHNNICLKTIERDRAVLELEATPTTLNPYGFVHGGALFSMADTAGGISARTDGRRYVTMSSSFNFLRSGVKGDVIRAEGRVRRRGHTTCFVEVDVSDSKGNLLASGTFTFYCIDCFQ